MRCSWRCFAGKLGEDGAEHSFLAVGDGGSKRLSARWVVDATDAPLGRVASEVATLLRGKLKPTFAPHVDGGDYVIVVNVERVAVAY